MSESIGSAGLAADRMSEGRVRSLMAMLDRGDRADWSRLADALGGPSDQLEAPVQRRMEGFLGHDLGQVRVHRSPQVESLAEHLGAEAFTIGARVFAPARSVEPASERGAGLLAHELTHVVQQTAPQPLPGGVHDSSLPAGLSTFSPVQRRADGENGPIVSREGEPQALAAERAALGAAGSRDGRRAPVDLEALAERVFRLMKEDLRVDRERGGHGWRVTSEVF